MKKLLLTIFTAGFCFALTTFGQVPSYVPTNGLVGWWPFNGNANDESGNGNNGVIIGALISSLDRFGNSNSSYNFTGNGYVQLPNLNLPSFTINAWVKRSGGSSAVISKHYTSTLNSSYFLYAQENDVCKPKLYYTSTSNVADAVNGSTANLCDGQWHMLTGTLDQTSLKLYVDGILVASTSGGIAKNTTYNTLVGCTYSSTGVIQNSGGLQGEIDDIGFWNVPLTQAQITTLYQGCSVNPTITPVTASLASGTNAQFTTPVITGGSYQWQTAPAGLNWQNVPSNTTYSGGATNTLNVSNIQLANHQQPFRVIVSGSSCTDTSAVALIEITDTCINTVNDTIYTTVTDTLIINTTLSLAPPNDQNTIKIYPNPASDFITIDNGNYSAMAGYSIEIENSVGQQVFQNAINQAQFYIDLSTWTGSGLYFVHLYDSQGNTVTVRKIVLQ